MPAELALRVAGETTEGRILRAEVDEHVRIGGEHPTYVSFGFEHDGVAYETRTTFVGVSTTEFPTNAPVLMEYVPWRPKWARISGGDYGFFPWWCAFVAIFPLIGLLLLYSAIRSNRREIRAYSHGQVANGEVVSFGPDTTVEVNGRHPMQVEWVFLVAGIQYRGKVTHMDTAFLAAYQVGVPIFVLYDPADPQINTLWVD